jgi:hypothetical protein
MARLAGPLVQATVLEEAVRSALEAAGWTVNDHPVIGSHQPDVLASGKSRPHLVIDIKATSRPIHFASVAQVASYVRAALDAQPSRDVRGVLLSVAPLTAAARDAAEKVGVTVLTGSDTPSAIDNPQILAAAWARELGDLELVPVTLDTAIKIAEGILARVERQFELRYGNSVAEVGAAPGLGWESLIQLEQKRAKGEEITEPRVLLTKIILQNVLSEVETAMRTMAPGARAHYRLVKKYYKQLASEELTETDRYERAMRLADDESERLGGLLIRIADERAIERVEDANDPYAKVFDEDIVRTIDDIVGLDAVPSRGRQSVQFTRMDRHTWSIFKAATLTGADIEWSKYGIDPHVGAQQLYALLRKIAAVVRDRPS